MSVVLGSVHDMKSYGLSVQLLTTWYHFWSHALVHIVTRYDFPITKEMVRVMFEPTSTLTNFTFGKYFLLNVAHNDQIWIAGD